MSEVSQIKQAAESYGFTVVESELLYIGGFLAWKPDRSLGICVYASGTLAYPYFTGCLVNSAGFSIGGQLSSKESPADAVHALMKNR